MSSRLGPDSSLHQVLSWIAALVLANLAFSVLAVPVVTAGAGLLVTAVVSARLIESESTALLPALDAAVRRAGPAACLLLLGEALLALLLAWEWTAAARLANPAIEIVAKAVLAFVALVLLVVHVWVWPMTAYRLLEKGSVAVRDLPVLVRASLLVGVAKLPRTILPVLVAIGPLALAAVSLPWAIRVGFWFLLFGVAFSTYVCVLAARPVLRPAMSGDEAGAGPSDTE